jgi:hypothetical protein
VTDSAEPARASQRWALLAILALAAALRFWGLRFGLPFPEARPDEMSLVMYSLGLLFAGLNPKFFHWPSFMLYTVAMIFRAAWEVGHWRGAFQLKFDMFRDAAVHATPYILTTRTLVALVGTATVWLLHRLATRIFDRTTALVAAFLLAVAFLHVRDSHFGVLDVPMTAFVVAAMLPFATTFARPEERRPWVLAAVCSGLAASTKYNGGIVALIGVASLLAALPGATSERRRRVATNFALFVAVTGGAFLAGTPFALLDAPKFIEDLRFDSDHLLGGHGLVLQIGWRHFPSFTLWYGLGAPLLMAGLAGMLTLAAVTVRRRGSETGFTRRGGSETRPYSQALLVCLFPLAYYAAIGRGYTVFARYVLPVVPFLCLAAAWLLASVTRRFSRPALSASATIAGALLLAAPSIQRGVAFDRLMTHTDTRVLALEWLNGSRGTDDWVYQAPKSFLYPEVGIERPANMVAALDPIGQFVDANGAAIAPQWIVLADSPLRLYTAPSPDLARIIERDYVLATMILATRGVEPPEWFDQQDQFFAPMADFQLRDRPGPEIRIFKRR